MCGLNEIAHALFYLVKLFGKDWEVWPCEEMSLVGL